MAQWYTPCGEASHGDNLPVTEPRLPCSLPSNYQLLDIMGKGVFGVVAKCFKRDSEETVAVKVLQNPRHALREAMVLQKLMSKGLDRHNIVRFHEMFTLDGGHALVFEILDMSLHEFMMQRNLDPLELADVRIVIGQLAISLEALKCVGVIHTDIKMDNIMLVDQLRKPYRVKLIDFGLAILRSKARQGGCYQACYCRAPEIIIGAPFAEGIDMWSLGCVMAAMLGVILFPGGCERKIMGYMTELFGQPDDEFLDAGLDSDQFFQKLSDSQWSLDIEDEPESAERRHYTFRSLDALKMMDLDYKDEAEVADREECVELLKEMLRMDPRERITPNGVLRHPFVKQTHLIGIPRREEVFCSALEYVKDWPVNLKPSQDDWMSAEECVDCSGVMFVSAPEVLTTAGEEVPHRMTSLGGEFLSTFSRLPSEDILDSNRSGSQGVWTTDLEKNSENSKSSGEILWTTFKKMLSEGIQGRTKESLTHAMEEDISESCSSSHEMLCSDFNSISSEKCPGTADE